MADLLTHVLVAYVVGVLLSFHYSWLTREHVTILMVGAILPDLDRLAVFLPDYLIETSLSIPFSWFGMHTLGGIAITATLSALIVAPAHRRRVGALLVLGALLHLVLDSLLFLPGGHAPALWWPLTERRLPTPGWYMSFHRWPAALAIVAAGIVWGVRRRTRDPPQ